MENEFVNYEVALKLNELGLNEPCFATYQYPSKILVRVDADSEGVKNSNFVNFITAPLYQQVFRWFREKYDLDSYIKPATLKTKRVYDYHIWFINEKEESDLFIGMNNEYSYEEAELACLNKLIEIVKQ